MLYTSVPLMLTKILVQCLARIRYDRGGKNRNGEFPSFVVFNNDNYYVFN